MRANIESLKEEITFVKEALEEEKLEKEVIEEALTEMQWLLKEKEKQSERHSEVISTQLKAAQEEGEINRRKLMQAEDEVLSLQGELEKSCQRTQAVTEVIS